MTRPYEVADSDDQGRVVVFCGNCERALTYTRRGWEEATPVGGNPLVCESNPSSSGVHHVPSSTTVEKAIKDLQAVYDATDMTAWM